MRLRVVAELQGRLRPFAAQAVVGPPFTAGKGANGQVTHLPQGAIKSRLAADIGCGQSAIHARRHPSHMMFEEFRNG